MSYLNKTEYKIVPVNSFEVIHSCGGCGKKQSFINTGRFRVNANGNRLDIWLIYQCKKCKHTLNIPIYERIDKAKVDSEEYRLFLENNFDFAQKYGKNQSFLRSRQLEADVKNAELEIRDMQDNVLDLSDNEPVSGHIYVINNESGLKLRGEKLASMIFGISRSAAKKLIDSEEVVIAQERNVIEIRVC